ETVRFDATATGERHAEGQPQDEQNLERQIQVREQGCGAEKPAGIRLPGSAQDQYQCGNRERERTAGEQCSSFQAASAREVKNADRIIDDYMSPTRAGQNGGDLAARALIAAIALALAACATTLGLEPTTVPAAPLAPPSVSPA